MQQHDRRMRARGRRRNERSCQTGVAVTKDHLLIARRLSRGDGRGAVRRPDGEALGRALIIQLELYRQFDGRSDREAWPHRKLSWRDPEQGAHESCLVVAEQQRAVSTVGDETIDPHPVIAAEPVDPGVGPQRGHRFARLALRALAGLS